jgi:hypothetical protein
VLQRLRQHGSGLAAEKHGIHRLIVIGLIAHTCIEATVRYAAELGYDVVVRISVIAGVRLKNKTAKSYIRRFPLGGFGVGTELRGKPTVLIKPLISIACIGRCVSRPL